MSNDRPGIVRAGVESLFGMGVHLSCDHQTLRSQLLLQCLHASRGDMEVICFGFVCWFVHFGDINALTRPATEPEHDAFVAALPAPLKTLQSLCNA